MSRRPPEPFADESPRAPGRPSQQLRLVETALDVSFPDDYREFLAWSDGWEGWLGESYLQLFSSDDLILANDDEFRRSSPGLLAVGGDGGLETFALDYRGGRTPAALVAVDPVAGAQSIVWLGPSFSEGLARLTRDPDGPWTPAGSDD